MKSNYKKLGNYIQQVNIKNKDLQVSRLLGINIDKFFMPSVANVVGTNMANYKVVKKDQFACNRMHVGRDYRIPIALSNSNEDFLVSPAYTVFKIIDEKILFSEYLMMWFSRKEFDRNAWFYTDADVRGGLHWDAFCNMELPIPSIEKQREIVREYNVVVDRIKLNENLNKKLEESAQAIYREWFVDFEFPNEAGKPYKSSGGEMVLCEELKKEVPRGWEVRELRDVVEYASYRIDVHELSTFNYVSTENMLPNRGGISKSSALPSMKNTTKFNKGNILISNIRPYFKKIWLSLFEGGCSNDILCFVPQHNINPMFIYSIMEQDIFFDYIMMGSKGTKMPRGDKIWIMNYKMPVPDEQTIDVYSNIVSLLRNKLIKSKKQNQHLKKLKDLLLSKMSK